MSKTAYESRFDDHLGALQTFRIREGHCNVPYAHVENGIALGRWVAYVRSRYRKDMTGENGPTRRLLSERHTQALSLIPGWSWEARRPGPTPKHDRNAEIRELRNSGISLSVIAETYGLSKQRIHQLCMESHD
mgnify:CR=1 FL=1